MAKIVWISDFDQVGSGYSSISTNLCNGLAGLGHNIIALGLSYKNEEHFNSFRLIAAGNVNECHAMFHNLVQLLKPDIIIVALDIPLQNFFLKNFQSYNIPYIAITPLESEPLCATWAMILMMAKSVFFISQFATNEAKKAGLNAKHLCIGIDANRWRLPTPNERKEARKGLLGIEDDDTFVVLTVADNQERKNLAAAITMMRMFKETTSNFRYVLVTREHCPVGWELRDLARDSRVLYPQLKSELMIFERGLDFETLWAMYCAANVFLLPSKGEGFGFPLMEAMSTGLPVIGTRTGAITEHVEAGGGWLIDSEYVSNDPYGNERRYFIDVKQGHQKILDLYQSKLNLEGAARLARAYVESRPWRISVDQLDYEIRSILNGTSSSEVK